MFSKANAWKWIYKRHILVICLLTGGIVIILGIRDLLADSDSNEQVL